MKKLKSFRAVAITCGCLVAATFLTSSKAMSEVDRDDLIGGWGCSFDTSSETLKFTSPPFLSPNFFYEFSKSGSVEHCSIIPFYISGIPHEAFACGSGDWEFSQQDQSIYVGDIVKRIVWGTIDGADVDGTELPKTVTQFFPHMSPASTASVTFVGERSEDMISLGGMECQKICDGDACMR